jgi:hypothetical protein
MTDITPDARVLEDNDAALLDADTPAGAEAVEFADLAELGKTPAPAAAATPAAGKPAAPAAAAPADDADLPEQFRGKSKKELARMYQEAHQTIGRQGSELGELRQKADFAIKASLEALRGRKIDEPAKPAAPASAEPRDESAFFAKPYETLGKEIENHPIIKEIRETLGRAAADQATARATASTEQFNRTHPDAPQILQDPEFRQWVSASPIRRSLLQRAHQAYDFHAGDEVFSTWKALRGAKQPASKAGEQPAAAAAPAAGAPSAADISAAAATLANARKAKADATAKAAAVPTGGASGAGKPAGGKKIFRRADVMRLMETDPERYEALADEIAQAYAENRVR